MSLPSRYKSLILNLPRFIEKLRSGDDIETRNESLKRAIELLLDLPNIQIKDAFQDTKGHYIVTIISTEKGGHCHKCKKRIEKLNGHGEFVTVRHLDILGHPLY